MTDFPTRRVAAAIIINNGRLLATQRGHGTYKDCWEFPGGKLEAGETSEKALVREIREELDCDIEIRGFLMTVEHDYPDFHLIMDCYLCGVDPETLRFVEHEDARWLGYEDLWSVKWLPADGPVLTLIEEQRLLG